MANRVPSAAVKDAEKDDLHSDDHTSRLPDELIAVSILPFLTLKEAAATSVLSSRWRHLWASTPRLDFDGTEALTRHDFTREKLDRRRHKYVRWVNKVLRSCTSYRVEEFRVHCNLDISSKESIDKWVLFALSRGVQRLEINLTNDGSPGSRDDADCYTFPWEYFPNSKVTCRDNPAPRLWHMDRCTSFEIKYLRTLSLNHVRVTGEAVQHLLCNCPVLELLSVSHSPDLVNLKICDPSLVLKHVKICYCFNLKLVEIRNTNIVSLKYIGRKIDFLLQNAPLLVDLHIGGDFTLTPDLHTLLSDFLPQLETFTLEKDELEENELRCLSTKFINLKHLVVKIDPLYDEDEGFSLPLLDLISASPCLQKLELEVDWGTNTICRREIRKVVRTPHLNLKELEFRGYYGHKGDIEFVTNIVANAPALVKIVVDPHYRMPCMKRSWNEIRAEEAATYRARRQLKKIVPCGIELRILDL